VRGDVSAQDGFVHLYGEPAMRCAEKKLSPFLPVVAFPGHLLIVVNFRGRHDLRQRRLRFGDGARQQGKQQVQISA
jgi:hypothetical protein